MGGGGGGGGKVREGEKGERGGERERGKRGREGGEGEGEAGERRRKSGTLDVHCTWILYTCTMYNMSAQTVWIFDKYRLGSMCIHTLPFSRQFSTREECRAVLETLSAASTDIVHCMCMCMCVCVCVWQVFVYTVNVCAGK